jgi:biotin synthase-like enzyme
MQRTQLDTTTHARWGSWDSGFSTAATSPVKRPAGFLISKPARTIHDLLAWANRLREHFKGNKVHLCSIVNAKAGGCSENCSFCAQSSFYQTGSPKYGFVDPETVLEAADEAQRNGVTAVGLVAAWKGLQEGPMLDEVCDRIRELTASGKTVRTLRWA